MNNCHICGCPLSQEGTALFCSNVGCRKKPAPESHSLDEVVKPVRGWVKCHFLTHEMMGSTEYKTIVIHTEEQKSYPGAWDAVEVEIRPVALTACPDRKGEDNYDWERDTLMNTIIRYIKEVEELQAQVTQLHDSFNEECKRSDDLDAKKCLAQVKYLECKWKVDGLRSALEEVQNILCITNGYSNPNKANYPYVLNIISEALQTNPSLKTTEKSEVPSLEDKEFEKWKNLTLFGKHVEFRPNPVSVPCEEVKEPSAEECLEWMFRNGCECTFRKGSHPWCIEAYKSPKNTLYLSTTPLEAIRSAMKSASYEKGKKDL